MYDKKKVFSQVGCLPIFSPLFYQSVHTELKLRHRRAEDEDRLNFSPLHLSQRNGQRLHSF